MAAPMMDLNEVGLAGMEHLQSVQANLDNPFPAVPWGQYQPPPQMIPGMLPPPDPKRLGIVDEARASRMSEKDIINSVIFKRNESSAQRKLLEPGWRHMEDIYNFRTHNNEKEEWQSDVIIPSVYVKARTFRDKMQEVLLEPERFFDLINEGEDYKNAILRTVTEWAQIVQRDGNALQFLLDLWESGITVGNGGGKITYDPYWEYRPHVRQVPVQDPNAIAQAQAMGMPPPMMPEVAGEPELRWRVGYHFRPIWHLYPDPWTDRSVYESWMVEEFEDDESHLEEMVKAQAYDSIQDIGAPLRIRTGEFRSRWQRLELTESQASGRRRHLVTEYTGDIHDADGNTVCKNWIVTIVNEKSIVRIGPNPNWCGRSRYVWSTPIRYPGRAWGRLPLESTAEFQMEESDLFNLVLDDAKYAVMSAWTLDPGLADEPDGYDSIEPGKIYRGKPGFLAKLPFPSQLASVWPVMQEMANQSSKASRISEFTDGQPTSRGRPSAEEVETKSQQSGASMHMMARNLEQSDVARTMQLTVDMLMMFGDETGNPRISKIIEDFGAPMLQDPITRMQLIDTPYRIEARGISMMASRERMGNDILQMIQMLMGLGVSPVHIIPVVYSFITLKGMRPEQVGLPAEPEEYMMMMMGMPPQAPGMGGGGVVPAGGGQQTGPGGEGTSVPPQPGA